MSAVQAVSSPVAAAALRRPKAFRRSSTAMSCARKRVCSANDPSGSLSKREIVAASAASSAGRSTSSDTASASSSHAASGSVPSSRKAYRISADGTGWPCVLHMAVGGCESSVSASSNSDSIIGAASRSIRARAESASAWRVMTCGKRANPAITACNSPCRWPPAMMPERRSRAASDSPGGGWLAPLHPLRWPGWNAGRPTARGSRGG